jgi:hypothetical protein
MLIHFNQNGRFVRKIMRKRNYDATTPQSTGLVHLNKFKFFHDLNQQKLFPHSFAHSLSFTFMFVQILMICHHIRSPHQKTHLKSFNEECGSRICCKILSHLLNLHQKKNLPNTYSSTKFIVENF